MHLKAVLAQTIFGVLASEYINDPKGIQEQIVRIGQMEDIEIIDLQVIILNEHGEFKIEAAKNEEKVGTIVTVDPTIIMPWYQDRPFARLDMENGQRAWYVVDSFYNKEGEKAGLIALTISLVETDVLIHQTIWKAYIFLIATILIVLILIAHHTKLFVYVTLYNKMKEIDEMKDSFIRMATHELQSPITVIRGYLEALEEEFKETFVGEKKEFLERIKISAQNLSDLVNDILEVSRLEQKRLDLTPQKVFPFQIITEIIQGLKIKTRNKKLDIIFENLKDDLYYIQINPNRFRQILINLVENAIKYTPEGKILVRTKKDENKKQYIIEVEDSGIGISAEHQKRLFEKFYRIKTKETAEIPGTGLGLWLTKQMVEESKGKIFVESIKDVGTKFILVFSLLKE